MNNFILVEENNEVSGVFSEKLLLSPGVSLAPQKVADLRIPLKLKSVNMVSDFSVNYQLSKTAAQTGLVITYLAIEENEINIVLVNPTTKKIEIIEGNSLIELSFSLPLRLKAVPARKHNEIVLDLSGGS